MQFTHGVEFHERLNQFCSIRVPFSKSVLIKNSGERSGWYQIWWKMLSSLLRTKVSEIYHHISWHTWSTLLLGRVPFIKLVLKNSSERNRWWYTYVHVLTQVLIGCRKLLTSVSAWSAPVQQTHVHDLNWFLVANWLAKPIAALVTRSQSKKRFR